MQALGHSNYHFGRTIIAVCIVTLLFATVRVPANAESSFSQKKISQADTVFTSCSGKQEEECRYKSCDKDPASTPVIPNVCDQKKYEACIKNCDR
jgi:hypothetical protein